MQRLLALVFALTFILGATGCGNVFVGGAIPTQTISGTVSIVQLTVLSGGGGTTVQVTAVTLLANGMASAGTFCGDQRSQFPMNTFVQANFTPGRPCSNLTTIVVGIKG